MEFQQLKRRNEELTILNSIAQNLNREVELNKALDATLHQLVDLLKLRTGWIWLFDKNNKSAYIAASYHLPPVFIEKPELLEGWCYCIEKYLTGKLEIASNISEITCTRLKNLKEGTDNLKYHASVPLFSRNEKIGILNVLTPTSQELAQADLRLLYTIGDMLSIAIERARLFENSRQLGIAQERNRLAREIHDTLAQGLSAISLKLETMDAILEKEHQQPKIEKLLKESLGLTKVNLEEARRSVLDLRAQPLQENNLIGALEKLIQEIPKQQVPKVKFKVKGKRKVLSLREEMGIFRISQEAITNVVKHAKADKLIFEVHFLKDEIQIILEDDGVGFEYDKLENRGFGLLGLNERVKLLNGKLEISSSPGIGTKLQANIPYVK